MRRELMDTAWVVEEVGTRLSRGNETRPPRDARSKLVSKRGLGKCGANKPAVDVIFLLVMFPKSVLAEHMNQEGLMHQRTCDWRVRRAF